MKHNSILKRSHILYINLDNRTDRKKHFESELQKYNLLNRKHKKTIRISGVNGQEIDNNYRSLAKEFNCFWNFMKFRNNIYYV